MDSNMETGHFVVELRQERTKPGFETVFCFALLKQEVEVDDLISELRFLFEQRDKLRPREGVEAALMSARRPWVAIVRAEPSSKGYQDLYHKLSQQGVECHWVGSPDDKTGFRDEIVIAPPTPDGIRTACSAIQMQRGPTLTLRGNWTLTREEIVQSLMIRGWGLSFFVSFL